jgi:hypothetical protein
VSVGVLHPLEPHLLALAALGYPAELNRRRLSG